MKTTDNSSTDAPKAVKKKSHPFWQWFWLLFLVGSLAYAWYSFYVPANDVVWAENTVSGREIASESDKNMLLFFTGEWCVPCRIMKREIFADKEVMKIVNSQVVPVMIDIDDPDAADIVQQYQVGGTPITIFTDPDGQVLDYAVGKIGKAEFLEMLGNLGTAGS